MFTTIDRVPIKPLIERYGKTLFYTKYLTDLGIKPTRDGASSYITPEQERLLEQYHEARGQSSEALALFLASLPNTVQNVHEQSSDIVLSSPLEQMQHLWMLVEAIATRLQQTRPEPLDLHRQLEEAAVNGWQLSTAQLREILGVSPVEGDRYGFRFAKAGRMGRQMGWTVEKTECLRHQDRQEKSL